MPAQGFAWEYADDCQDCAHTMRLFRKTLNRRKSSRPTVDSPFASRRQSQDITITTISSSGYTSQRPSITMLPRDSAAAISDKGAITPPHLGRRVTNAGPYCPKKPKLEDILANRSSRPWTLEAFTAYCEQNLCIENLLFIQEAQKYQDAYRKWSESANEPLHARDLPTAQHLTKHWKEMLAQYIATGGAREVNLTGHARDALLSIPDTGLPAHPDSLVAAVRLTHRLIEDSILFPFLNDYQHECLSHEDHIDLVFNPKDDMRPKTYSVQVDPHHSRPSSRDLTSPISTPAAYASNLFGKRTPHSQKATSNPPQRVTSRPKSMFVNNTHSISSGSGSIDATMIDDSTSTTITPATSYSTTTMSPPASESGRPSQRSRSDSGWKKFGARLGFKKKLSTSQLRAVKNGENAILED